MTDNSSLIKKSAATNWSQLESGKTSMDIVEAHKIDYVGIPARNLSSSNVVINQTPKKQKQQSTAQDQKSNKKSAFEQTSALSVQTNLESQNEAPQ